MLREVTYRDHAYTHRSVLRLVKQISKDDFIVRLETYVNDGNIVWECQIIDRDGPGMQMKFGHSMWDALSKVVKSMSDEQLKGWTDGGNE